MKREREVAVAARAVREHLAAGTRHRRADALGDQVARLLDLDARHLRR